MTTDFSASRCWAPRPGRSWRPCRRRCWRVCRRRVCATRFLRTRRWRKVSMRYLPIFLGARHKNAMNVLELTAAIFAGALVAGFLGALTGLGGGIVVIPLLTLVLGVDI